MSSAKPYSKEQQTHVVAGTKEAAALLKRAKSRLLHPYDEVKAKIVKSKQPKVKTKPKNKLRKAQETFNKWIRKRDDGHPCINCGEYRKLQAGHLYPTSTHSWLRFHEHNVNGECVQCNYFNSQSHQYGYRKNLEIKIGTEALKRLDLLASVKVTVRNASLIYDEIIEKYKL